jgi:LacI family transcriptional regulator
MEKMTIKRIASLTGLSVGTVSNVINNSSRVKEINRNKVLEVIEKYNYRPSRIASSLVRRKTNNIGFIIPDITNPYFPDILRGVQDYLLGKNHYVFLCNSDGDIKKEDGFLDDLANMWVDGIILDPCTSFRNTDKLKRIKTPIVLIDRQIRGIKKDIIEVDNENGAYKMTKLLIDKGHKKILSLHGSKKLSTAIARYKGWKRAMEEKNLFNEEFSFWDSASVTDGYNSMKRILEKISSFDGIFVSNDVSAIGVINCLQQKGFKVPEDISVVGFDDIYLSKYVKPALTTFRNYTYKMGEVAADIMLRKIESNEDKPPRSIIVKGEVILRDSVINRLKV